MHLIFLLFSTTSISSVSLCLSLSLSLSLSLYPSTFSLSVHIPIHISLSVHTFCFSICPCIVQYFFRACNFVTIFAMHHLVDLQVLNMLFFSPHAILSSRDLIFTRRLHLDSAAKKRSPHSNHALLSAISLPNVLSTIDEALKSESPRRAESACGSERQDYRHFSITTITSTPPLTISVDSEDYTKEDLGLRLEGRHFDNEELTPSGPQRSQVSESNSNSNDMNQSTWNADDRIFLLEELEKKDNMLAMLTEGLREVR